MSKSSTTKIEDVQNDIDTTLASLPTKSSKIRHLLGLGWTRGKVAKHLNIRYQHVRNVEITPIKKQKA